VLRLHKLPRHFKNRIQHYVGFSRSGAGIATTSEGSHTVNITSLLAQPSLQFIDAGMWINGLVLTGNILLVAGSKDVVAWLLTEEGVVGGVTGGRNVCRSDRVWTVSHSQSPWVFSVEGQVGIIKQDGDALHVYDTETGEVLHPTQAPQHFSGRWHNLSESHWGRDYLCYHNLPQCATPPEDSWQISRAAVREGWVKDPEGKRRLWVPFEWRTDWDPADWCHDATTQLSSIGGRPVLIKF
jgi:hypothetical protein